MNRMEKFREMLYIALDRGDKKEILRRSQELDAEIALSQRKYQRKQKGRSQRAKALRITKSGKEL